MVWGYERHAQPEDRSSMHPAWRKSGTPSFWCLHYWCHATAPPWPITLNSVSTSSITWSEPASPHPSCPPFTDELVWELQQLRSPYWGSQLSPSLRPMSPAFRIFLLNAAQTGSQDQKKTTSTRLRDYSLASGKGNRRVQARSSRLSYCFSFQGVKLLNTLLPPKTQHIEQRPNDPHPIHFSTHAHTHTSTVYIYSIQINDNSWEVFLILSIIFKSRQSSISCSQNVKAFLLLICC